MKKIKMTKLENLHWELLDRFFHVGVAIGKNNEKAIRESIRNYLKSEKKLEKRMDTAHYRVKVESELSHCHFVNFGDAGGYILSLNDEFDLRRKQR
jgi:hypothetical protein